MGLFNGVGNTEKQAKRSLKVLKKHYGYESKTPNKIKFDYQLFYNETHGLFYDLVEVFEKDEGKES